MLTKEDILAIAELMDERLMAERQAVSEMMDEKLKPLNDRLDGIDCRLDGMDHRLAEVETHLRKVDKVASGAKILIENEIDRAIKVLGEGHEGILGGMKDLVTQEQLEEVSVRVFALEEGFKKHSQQIEELQQKIG